MLRNFVVIALRNLVKSPGLSAIKIIGLSIGVCGCIIVFLLANLELSFDRHHTNGHNVYRVYTKFSGVYDGQNRAVPLPFPAEFRERATGVEVVSQVLTNNYDVIIKEGGTEKKFEKPNYSAFVDSNYFKVFPDYKWIAGNAAVLKDPYTVVVTESKAKTYFGVKNAADAVGKRVYYRDSLEVTVGGVIADVEHNTDYNFTEFISLSTAQSGWLKQEFNYEEWGSVSSGWLCMIRLAEGTSASNLEPMLDQLAKEKDEQSDKSGEPRTTFTHFKLQPLSDMHFNSELGTWNDGRSTTSMNTIKALGAISILLLIVAVINFVNLETAQALRRAKEVGLRKAMGGTRGSLMTFFVAESFVITFMAVVLAIPLAKLSMMLFSEFLPKEIAINFTDPLIIVFVLGLTIIVTLLSGIYPALVLSSYQPVVALKASRNSDRSGNAFLRRILTVFQFTFSQALIAGAMIIGLQIAWMLNKDLGFSHEAIVTIQPPWWEKKSKRPVLRNEIEKMSFVEKVAQTSRPVVAQGWSTNSLIYNDGKENMSHSVHSNEGDTSYVSLFKLQLIAGRNIQPVDSLGEILVNETYCDKLGIAPIDMVGKEVRQGNGTRYQVVGVLKDFHHASLHKAIEPWYYKHQANSFYTVAKISKNADLTKSIEQIKEAAKQVYGDQKLTITFMDDTVQKFYESEKRIAKLANTATGLAIFISCLGLLGLASFNAIQRTKEIGIRKVLGASVNNIITLLSREFIVLALISFVIAVPIAWYGGNQWLSTFPYRMDIGVWVFLAAGMVSIIVSLITVGYQALKAAIVNPVDSLRYE